MHPGQAGAFTLTPGWRSAGGRRRRRRRSPGPQLGSPPTRLARRRRSCGRTQNPPALARVAARFTRTSLSGLCVPPLTDLTPAFLRRPARSRDKIASRVQTSSPGLPPCGCLARWAEGWSSRGRKLRRGRVDFRWRPTASDVCPMATRRCRGLSIPPTSGLNAGARRGPASSDRPCRRSTAPRLNFSLLFCSAVSIPYLMCVTLLRLVWAWWTEKIVDYVRLGIDGPRRCLSGSPRFSETCARRG